MNGLSILAASVPGLVAKATLILSLALALAWFARRNSARALHLLWTATFVALLALPGAILPAPSWELPLPPIWSALLPTRTVAHTVPAEPLSPEAIAGDPPATAVAPFRADQGQRLPASPTPATHPSVSGTGNAPSPRTPGGALLVLWALGCGAGLVSLAVGALRFRRIVRQATPMNDPAWIQSADRLRSRMRVGAGARILSSARVPAPMTGGLFRPVILLPAAAAEWTACQREVVLSHELVHVRRRDAVRQFLGRIVAALYWFHPLCWIALRLATAARERSCDEEVLALGVRPSAYARLLLALASGLARRPPVLSLSMTQPSHLENRIMSILQRRRPRYSKTRAFGTLAVLAGGGLAVACARPVPMDPAPGPPAPVEVVPLDQGPAASSALAETPESQTEPAPAPEMPLAEFPVVVPPEAAPPVPTAPRPQEIECTGAYTGTDRGGGSTTFQVSVDAEGMWLCMRTFGGVVLNEDRTAIERMDADGRLLLESQAERRHRLTISPGPDGFEQAWSIDGRSRPFNDEARQWRDLVFAVLAGYREAWEIRGMEAGLQREMASHQRHVAGLQREAASHQRHVAGLRREVASHERHVSGLRREIASHERDAASLHRAIALLERREKRQGSQATTEMQDELAAIESAMRRVRQAIEDYDLPRQVRGVEQAIERYDLDGEVREIELAIQRYDLGGKVGAIEAQIEQYDLDGKIREIEERIEELDADRQAGEIQQSIQDEIEALRRLIG